MQLARLIMVLAFISPAAMGFPEERNVSPAPAAYEHVQGVLKKVGRSGRIIAVENAAGKKTRIELPEDIRVEKRIAISELAAGEWVHVTFSSSKGQDEIKTVVIDRLYRLPAGPVWDGSPLPEPPGRYQGTVKTIDNAARRLAIERVDGQIRWFSLKPRMLILATGSHEILSEGDMVFIAFRGSTESGKPVSIKAESSEARGKR